MGLSLGFSKNETGNIPPPPPNPNPYRFTVLKRVVHENRIIALVNYEDCINYEGFKILVFKDMDIEEFDKLTCLDPHFSNIVLSGRLLARFAPTEEGWNLALRL